MIFINNFHISVFVFFPTHSVHHTTKTPRIKKVTILQHIAVMSMKLSPQLCDLLPTVEVKVSIFIQRTFW